MSFLNHNFDPSSIYEKDTVVSLVGEHLVRLEYLLDELECYLVLKVPGELSEKQNTFLEYSLICFQ